uniref:Uncharacterized protein n=1 Tax=viral metagenome TaxID=1070528 RepID=A0A6M3IWM4_9ZZZZ
MNADFAIYNKVTGEIYSTGNAPEEMVSMQNPNPNKFSIYYGKAYELKQKIINDMLVDLTQKEIDDKHYATIIHSKIRNILSRQNFKTLKEKVFDSSITDEKIMIFLSAFIRDFFYGKENPDVWIKTNYSNIRSVLYPPIEDYLDAMIKISDSDPEKNKAGQKQLDEYLLKGRLVKQRFPK